MNYLGLDYWTKKTWLAININNIAVPLIILETKNIIPELKKIILERKIETIVIWMANNVDGSESLHSKRIRSFANLLKKEKICVKIVFHDERFSTYEAISSMDNIWEKNYDPKKLDDIAASIILQSYLDTNNK